MAFPLRPPPHGAIVSRYRILQVIEHPYLTQPSLISTPVSVPGAESVVGSPMSAL